MVLKSIFHIKMTEKFHLLFLTYFFFSKSFLQQLPTSKLDDHRTLELDSLINRYIFYFFV